MKISLTVLLAAIFTTSKAVVPNYSPAIGGNAALAQDEVIQTYFNAQEIVLFLVSVHGIRISVRHLKRILRRLGCSRHRFQSNLDEIVEAVEKELKGSGSLLGYRAMHQRLLNQYGLLTTREVVQHVLKIFDTEGLEHRLRHRLRRP